MPMITVELPKYGQQSKPSPVVELQSLLSAQEGFIPRPSTDSSCRGGATHQRSPRKICPSCGGPKSQHATMCRTCTQAAQPKSVELICDHCGAAFSRQPSEHEKAKRRHGEDVKVFCNRKCYEAYKKEHPERYSKVNGACVGCGKSLVGKDKKKFCSVECYANYRKQRRATGEYNSSYLTLKALIYKRDGYACQLCGAGTSRLQAHHLDHNPENNQASNLISLCQTCHNWYHTILEPAQTVLRTLLKEKATSL